jgi:hypothetical protein
MCLISAMLDDLLSYLTISGVLPSYLPRQAGATLNFCTMLSSGQRNSLNENVCTFM